MNKAWFILFLATMVACKQNPVKPVAKDGTSVSAKTDDGEPVFSFSKHDTAMNAAIAEAKRTYPAFERMVYAGDTSAFEQSVKMIFNQDGQVEHMWVGHLHRKGDKLYGILNSDPYYIDSLSIGDTILIDKNYISDWVYARHGRMVGGYTLWVMYNNMSEEEKQTFKATLPFEIEKN